ncbi:ADP ATP carrier protein 1 mitochondrial [Bienertia sinuspersici]
MSTNQGTGTGVLFVAPDGSSLFSTPLPLPPVPVLTSVPKSPFIIPLQQVSLGLMFFMTNTVVAPLERVHLLMQNQNEMIKSGCLSTPYKGMKDCFLRTIKQEGIISLWRGNCVNLCKALTSQAFAIAMYKNSWHNLGDNRNDEFGELKFKAAIFSATLFHYPLDYARTRVATDFNYPMRVYHQFSLDSARKDHFKVIRTREFSGMFDVYRQTLLLNGITGLYKGYFLSFLEFLAWDYSNLMQEATFTGMIMPNIALYSLPVVFYPLTSLSRRMMMNSSKASIRYKYAIHAFNEIVKNEGLSSLYKGVTAGVTLCFARIFAFKAFAETSTIMMRSYFSQS